MNQSMNIKFTIKFTIQFAVDRKVIGVVITISSVRQPNASPARCNAAVPLATTQAWLEPKYFFNSSSNFGTAGPWVSQSPFKTDKTESISDWSMDCFP